MRRFVPPAAALLLAACATAPKPAPPAPAPVPDEPRPQTGPLLGLTVSELGARFGQPTFQVREGVGTKLQWSQNGCVLDAYLYPPPNGQGVLRVMHVDTRRPSGADIDLQGCMALLAR